MDYKKGYNPEKAWNESVGSSLFSRELFSKSNTQLQIGSFIKESFIKMHEKFTNKYNYYLMNFKLKIVFVILIMIYFLFKKSGEFIQKLLTILIIFIILFLTKNNTRIEQCLYYNSHLLIDKQKNPNKIINQELLKKPLNEFLISTSHNTYIPCLQNADISSVYSIKNALELGARVIELDVFAKNNTGILDDDYTPVVTHGLEIISGDFFTNSVINFEDCIKTVYEFSKTTPDPIWIDMELNTHKLKETQQKMRNILLKYFKDKLLSSEFKINNKNQIHFSTSSLGSLQNKIILTSCKPKDEITEYLIDLIDSYAGDGIYLNHNHKSNNLNKINPPNIIQRIYPAGNIFGHFSFNYDPEPFWKNKHQLVALNFQNPDENLLKNMALFKSSSFVHFSEVELNNSL